MVRGLEEGHLGTRLRRLKLKDCSLSLSAARILIDAIGRGACPLLQELDMSRNPLLEDRQLKEAAAAALVSRGPSQLRKIKLK